MHLYKTASIIFLFAALMFSQEQQVKNLDSVYNTYISALSGNDEAESHHNEKCGFRFSAILENEKNNLSEGQKKLLKTLAQRPVKQKSIVSPKGYFRIHFDTTGSAVPAYSISEFAAAADFSYDFEIGTLGYLPPPSDNNAGGDNLYDIYINDVNPFYGITEPEFTSGNKGPSFIIINNDFSGFYTQGIEAAKVTIAHEFFHAVQLGSYIYRADDLFFYELTATAMEEFAFDDINDYYGYLAAYFDNPEQNLANYDGYEISIWNIYLEKKYGHSILKRQWDLMPNNRALKAIEISLQEKGAVFKEALNEFGIWTWFTGPRSIPGKYFEEADNYPILDAQTKLQFTSPDESVTINSQPAANNYINFFKQNPAHFTGMDSLIAVITNGDVNAAINNPSATFSFTYTLYDANAEGRLKLTDNYFISVNTAQPGLWTTSEILNNQVIKEGLIAAGAGYVFPSPYIYELNASLYIPAVPNENSEAELNIYTSAMELVYSSTSKVVNNQIRWNARNSSNEKLASGVYVYAVKTGDDVQKGKLVIINNE